MIIWFVRLAAAAGCLAAGALAALFTWSDLEAKNDPGRVYALTGSSKVLLALIEKRANGEGMSTEALANGSLLQRAPLSDVPLALAGLSAVRAGDVERADRAFLAAFARSPRNVAARIWLAERAIGQGHMDQAIDLLDRLIAISPNQASVYVQALAQIGMMPGGAQAIERKIGADAPNWGAAVISRLNNSYPDLEWLLRLNALNKSTQAEFLQRVTKERGPQGAFLAWLNFIPTEDVQTFKWPYNNRFERRGAPPPFNWTLQGRQVEFVEPSGLALTYLGRGRSDLVEQQVLLAPGEYVFSSTMKGQGSVNGGGLRWSIACASGAVDLAYVVIHEFSARSTTKTFNFTIPAEGCDAQRLWLRGEPGEFPTIVRAEIASVSIEKRLGVNGQ